MLSKDETEWQVHKAFMGASKHKNGWRKKMYSEEGFFV